MLNLILFKNSLYLLQNVWNGVTRVDIAQCELRTDKGCYRQEIGQVEEEGSVFVLNTMDEAHTFCL